MSKSILYCILWRDIQLVLRRRSDVTVTLFFFVVTVSLFPLGLGADTMTLRNIGAGVLWVAALLSTMLSLGRLFAMDYADGTLEQMLLSPVSLSLAVAMKILAHWLVSGLPLVLIAPVLGLQFDLPSKQLGVLMLSLLLGTPLLSLIGAIGAALTIGTRGSGALLAVLILPLYIPVLIFGAGAVTASASGMSPEGALSLLAALLILGVVFIPYAAASTLRMVLE
jgi:heme exporter protein B